jgi:hypothetical protein
VDFTQEYVRFSFSLILSFSSIHPPPSLLLLPPNSSLSAICLSASIANQVRAAGGRPAAAGAAGAAVLEGAAAEQALAEAAGDAKKAD